MQRAEAGAARARLKAASAEDGLVRARADLKERQALLDATYRSHSWRVTAPLRAFGNAMRRRRARRDHLRPRLLARPDKPTLFIECTHTYHSDVNTGIQRVVRNVLRNAAVSATRYGYAVVPVVLEGNQFVAADLGQVLADKSRVASPRPDVPANVRGRFHSLAQNLWRLLLRALTVMLPFAPAQRFLFASPDEFGLAWCVLLPLRALRIRPWPKRITEPSGPISLDEYASCADSILVLLDSSWHIPIWPTVEQFRRRGGRVVGAIYDLIPITHSYACVPELVACFRHWFHRAAGNIDAFVAISQSTAQQLRSYLSSQEAAGGWRTDVPISHFYLGSELDFAVNSDEARPTIKNVFDTNRHLFLMVGSIEPRKKHDFVLDSFERFWSRGGEASLMIIGRQGWKMEAFLDRVASHPEHGQRLHLVRDATDSELDYAYRNASALIIASEIEGFGLPVVEAFQHGLPVLCSDIPVFREIAEGRATFFSLDDPGQLAATIAGFCASHDPARRSDREPQSWLTWQESTEQLFAAMMEGLERSGAPHTEVLTG